MSKFRILFVSCIIVIVGLLLFQKTQTDEIETACFYQFGAVKLFSLLDGHIDFPVKNIIKDGTNFDNPLFHESSQESVAVPINIFLIDTGAQKILIDVGLAGKYGSATGQLQQSLQQAGYVADQITAIFITHFHPDHISGLIAGDGSKIFMNADLYVAQAEIDYWLRADVAQDHQSIANFMQQSLALYTVHTFAPDQQLFDNCVVVASPGHTPGHAGFLWTFDQTKVFIWGDIIHMPQIQFAHPAISFKDDSDHEQAIVTREHLLQQAAQGGWIIAGVHLASPGVGTVQVASNSTTDQPAYIWVAMQPQC